jgi:hypothetical protein
MTSEWKKRLVQQAAGFVIATILAETILRILGVGDLDLYQPDLDRGIAHRPVARGWFTKEGRSYVVINRDGFRDIERIRPKPPRTFRVAVLGDSFTEALQVSVQETFCAVMESELANCSKLGQKHVEVLNFGVSDYGLASEFQTLRTRVWSYEPDLVIVALFTANDILDSNRELKQNSLFPYYLERNGQLVLDTSFRKSSAFGQKPNSLLQRGFRASRLLQRIRQLWVQAKDRWRNSGQTAAEFDPNWYQNPVYQTPQDSRWVEAWKVTEGLIRLFHGESVSHQVPIAIVTLSNAPQVHPDHGRRERLVKSLGISDLFYADRRVGAFCNAEQIPVLNLAPVIEKQADSSGVFFHGFGSSLGTGHYNQEGHRLVGRILARWVCEQFRSWSEKSLAPSTQAVRNES